jgi:hypothetical protein
MMSPIAVMYTEFYMSLTAFALIAAWYVVPALRRRPFAEAVTPILLLHSFRHFGLFYITAMAVPSPPPIGFAAPTAYGDVATALVALVALVAVRKIRGLAVPLVWVFNLVGVGDLVLATVNAQRYGLAAYSVGVAYVLPILVVPALLVSHALVFWLLVRRAPPARAAVAA